MDSPRFIAAAIQAAAVSLGHCWGLAVHYPGRPPTDYTLAGQFAVFLMLVGIPLTPLLRRPMNTPNYRNWVCIGTLLYAHGTTLLEPFLFVHHLGEIIIGALTLAPLLLALGYSVRARDWVTAAGIAVFVCAASAMITSNANTIDAGSGFFARWQS